MKMRTLVFCLFAVASLVQLYVPASMIHRYESTLGDGQEFMFKTKPVDPYDAFRGRFVSIRIDPDSFVLPAGTQNADVKEAYAVLGVDSDGYARIENLTLTPPSGMPFVTVGVSRWSEGNVGVRWPFDRVYLNENIAPQAEAIYREHSSTAGPRDAYVAVRVRDGQAVVKDLYIGEKRIQEYFQKTQ